MDFIKYKDIFKSMLKDNTLRFLELGYSCEYKEGSVDETEHYIIRSEDVITFSNDKCSFQFNLNSETIVVQDLYDTSRFYQFPTIFITSELLDAINEVVVLFGWK